MLALVCDEVLLCQDLSAGRADPTVQLWVVVVACLPGVLLVLFGLAGGLAVVVSGKELLLLARVRQKHQQLVEDPLEVLSQQLSAALVVLHCRHVALSKLSRESFKLVELGLLVQQEVLYRLDELHVPELEILRHEVGPCCK